jgi:hypothetical protein
VVKHGIVRECFDGRRAHERRQIDVGHIQLVAPALKIGPEEIVSFVINTSDIFESARARDLLGKHPVERRIDPVSVDRDADELRDALL